MLDINRVLTFADKQNLYRFSDYVLHVFSRQKKMRIVSKFKKTRSFITLIRESFDDEGNIL